MVQHVEYCILQGDLEIEIDEIVYNSKKAKDGTVFVCIEGTQEDGHHFAEEAVKKGSVAIICSKPLSLKENISVILVEDCRKTLAAVSAMFYGYPANQLFLIGITGTKGKTSTAYMIKNILSHAGIKTGLIGTVEIDTGKRRFSSCQTTPESLDLHGYLREMVLSGCSAVVMEVSSQALKQSRVHGMTFDVAVFTNMEEDHIGEREHADFEEYVFYKSKLFSQCKVAVMNGDDNLYQRMADQYTGNRLLSYGMTSGNLYVNGNIDYVRLPGKFAVEFQVKGMYNINLVVSGIGDFSAYNAIAALLAAKELGVSDASVQEALKSVLIPGRQEIFSIDYNRSVIVDYAHNGMALTSLLKALRKYQPKKITCVFGCGGERDRSRREKMGEAAAKFADFSIITSDNPRNESPSSIISDIIYKIECFNGKYCVIEDRHEAIAFAIEQCSSGEIIVIAGKGHEDYQIIGKRKIHFDDREEVRASIEKVKNGQNYNRRSKKSDSGSADLR